MDNSIVTHKYESIVYPRIERRVSHALLPLLIKRYQATNLPITDEYMALLFNWHHKLLKKYFKADQHPRHRPRTLDVILLFLKFSREYVDRDAPWLMTKWRFCIPDILFYLKLREDGVAVEEQTVKEIIKSSSTVVKLRELEVLSVKLRELGLPVTRVNLEKLWRQKRKARPLPKTLANFREQLNTRENLHVRKKAYEHGDRNKDALLSSAGC